MDIRSLMLHAKFQDHRIIVSGEEDFQRLSHLGQFCYLNFSYKLSFLLPKEASYEIWL